MTTRNKRRGFWQEHEVSWEVYDRVWRPVEENLFTGAEVPENPFRNQTWSIVPLMGVYFPSEDWMFDALVSMTTPEDRAEVMLKGGGGSLSEGRWDTSQERNNVPLILDLSVESLAVGNRKFSWGDFVIFPRSGAWGLYGHCEVLSLVGGPPSVIAKFVDSTGLDRLKDDFEQERNGVGPREFTDKLEKFAVWS